VLDSAWAVRVGFIFGSQIALFWSLKLFWTRSEFPQRLEPSERDVLTASQKHCAIQKDYDTQQSRPEPYSIIFRLFDANYD
jgi:hypothetical protein